jgi:hypothetical protein
MAHGPSAFEEQFLDVTKAELKSEMPARGAVDNRGRKAMTMIKRSCVLHRPIYATASAT